MNSGLPKCLLAVISDTSHMITDLLGVSEKGERVSFARSSLKLQLESGCVAYCLCWLLILDCFQTANHVVIMSCNGATKKWFADSCADSAVACPLLL